MRRWAAIGGLTLLAAAAYFAVRMWDAREVAVELVRPAVAEAQWEAYVAAVEAGETPAAAAAEPLVAAFAAVNAAELSAQTAGTDLGYIQASQAMQKAAWTFVQQRSAEEYVQVGRRQAFALADALAGLAAACGATPVSDCVRQSAEPAVAAYGRVGGRFVDFAEPAGFMRGNAVVDGQRPFIQALAVRHWMRWVQHEIDLSGYLRGEERAWYLRWRAEQQPNIPLAARLSALDELSGLAGYPAQLNAGVLLYHAGRFEDAAARFAQAKEGRAEGYLRMAERAGR